MGSEMCIRDRLIELATSRGLSFGQGVFETILVQNNNLILERQHFARIAKGARNIGVEFDQDLALKVVLNFLHARQETSGILKIILMAAPQRQGAPRGYGQCETASGVLILLYSSCPSVLQPGQIQSVVRIPEPLYPAPSALVGLKMIAAPQYLSLIHI